MLAPLGSKRIFVADVSVGMDADRGDVQFAAGGAFVEGLDVLEDVFELEAVVGMRSLATHKT